MRRPDFLKRGDSVALVAPGRKIKSELIEYAADILRSWGLDVVLSTNLFSNKHNYLAGTDEQRAADFQTALNDPSIRAIICVRGGYGSTRIIDQLDFSAFQQNPKWIVGFSDITAFHLKLFNLGIESIHATMPVLFSKADSVTSVESLKKNLFGTSTILEASAHSMNRIGGAAAQVVGGNLSLIIDSIGTSCEPDTNKKILIVEEIEEYFYKIDRMFTQLKRAGKLQNLAGLVVGHFTDIQDSELGFGETVEQIIMNAVKEFDFPVAFGFPTGHENPNIAWRSGAIATLEVTPQWSKLFFNDSSIV